MKGKAISESVRAARYVMDMLPVLNVDALFSDESAEYVRPMEPVPGDLVTIRLRTAKANVDEVWLISGNHRVRMEFEKTQGAFDFYAVRVAAGRDVLSWYFEVMSGAKRVFLSKYGITTEVSDRMLFRVCPGFSTPDWAKGAVMYQIYTDRFCNGDPSNDVLDGEYRYINKNVHHVPDWNKRPEAMDVRNFYGGDLEGVRRKLDYLKDLGIEAIYFNPLFVSPSNHKYDTQDYDHIDPHFGKIVTDEGELLSPDDEDARPERYISRVTRKENLEASDQLFARLVREAHERGIRVILDGVFNHCGSFNKWLDRERLYEGGEGYMPGAFESADSPYRDFFRFSDENAWPDNTTYEGWWNHDTLPKLNYDESKKLTSYILEIARKWVSPPFCADGWRLDVAADLGHSKEFNHSFWKAFRHEVKRANPEAVIIAEHYGDAQPWLNGLEWDTIMNYDAFMEPLTWFFTGMEKHSDEFLPDRIGNADAFFGSMRYHMCSFMESSLLCSMNQLSNHDHSRFLTRTNHRTGRVADFDYDAASADVDKGIMRQAVLMQMTWPGAPTLYYGDEAGVCGFTDPDSRRTYPWGHEDKGMLEFHRRAIALHRAHRVLRTGSLKFLASGDGYLAYARFDSTEQVACAFNITDKEISMTLPVWTAGVPMDAEMEILFDTEDPVHGEWAAEHKTDGKAAKSAADDAEDPDEVMQTIRVVQGEIHLVLRPRSALAVGTLSSTKRMRKLARKRPWWHAAR